MDKLNENELSGVNGGEFLGCFDDLSEVKNPKFGDGCCVQDIFYTYMESEWVCVEPNGEYTAQAATT